MIITEPYLTVCALIGVLLAILVAPYILWPLIGNRPSMRADSTLDEEQA